MKDKIFKRGKGFYCRCKNPHIFYSLCLDCNRFISYKTFTKALNKLYGGRYADKTTDA